MTVGRYLKSQREERGEELEGVAEMLRIHRAYLHAIETDEIDRLPGPTYAVGFVRAYAEHLGLDGAKVVDRFKEEAKGFDTRTQLVFPSPLPEGRVPSGAILLLAVVFMAAAYGGWIYVSSYDSSLAEIVPSLPDRFVAFVGGDSPAAPEALPPALVPGSAGQPESEKATGAPSGEAAPPLTASDETQRTPDGSLAVTSASGSAPAASPVEPSAAASPAPGASGGATEKPATGSDTVPASSGTAAAVAASEPSGASTVNVSGDSGTREATSVPTPGETTNTATRPDGAAGDDARSGTDQSPQQTAAAESRATEPPISATAAAPGVTVTALTGGGVANYPPDPPLPTFRETPQVFGTENQTARIVIHAIGDSWVEVRDRSGALLLTRVLRTGDRYQAPDHSGLTLVTGNAGGLEISVDGTTVPSIGPVGTVRRNVALDPDALKNGTAHLN